MVGYFTMCIITKEEADLSLDICNLTINSAIVILS